MCGIAGIYSGPGGPTPERGVLEAMARTLVHRGPDDEGYHIAPGLGLGFRRLSIIDLSGGNQPIYSEDRSVVIVCNGEIFNYLELRAWLIGKGHRFATNSDVEVLVHLYEEKGPRLLDDLNGQFAFALYDDRKKTLLLARDPVGIAPLFYSQTNAGLVFASEAKAVLAHPDVHRSVDLVGLEQCFMFPASVSPRTAFDGISLLPPGHFILAGPDGGIELHQYWDMDFPLEDAPQPERTEDSYIEELDALLRRSIELRLRADVPVGVYLSGGLDSSLIAGLTAAVAPSHSLGRHSFSIGFTQAEIDERRYQRMMAEHARTIHHETVFDWPHISERFHKMVLHAESPLKETYDTCSLALSESVRKAEMKVVLVGEGADEMFAGYYGYKFDSQRALAGDIDTGDMAEMYDRELRAELWGDEDFIYEKNMHEMRETTEALFSDPMRAGLDGSFPQPVVERGKLEGRHLVNRRAYIDLKLRLAGHLLSDHGDRVAFANSVEARYPFLDPGVMEFSRTLPPGLKLGGLTEKYILKKLAARYVPTPIIERQKFGFVAPSSPYLLGRDIEWVNDTLSYETIRRQGYFNPDVVERLKARYGAPGFMLNVPYEDDLLMLVLTFGVFLELFKLPSL